MNNHETKNELKVHLGGQTQPSKDINGVIIPITMLDQYAPWAPLISSLQKIMGDRMLVTSILQSFNGQMRSGTSHPNGWAIDVTFPDRVVPKENPHFENDIYLMTYLAGKLKGPVMFAFESDHVHIEVSDIITGVYRYPTSRPTYYSNDRLVSPRLVSDEQLWSVTPTSIILMKDQSRLLAQRKATDSKLSRAQLSSFISRISLR